LQKNISVSDYIKEELKKLADSEYRDFHSKLMPGIPKEKILGVRIPHLRKFAVEFKRTGDYHGFLNSLPHEYYEENNLHAFLIEQEKDIEAVLYETERFLPYIDNWATCDSFFPKVFKKYPDILEKKAKEWINSNKTYTVRYGIGIFMKMFLDENFSDEFPRLVSEIKSEEYYVNMMIAWYFATAIAKRYEDSVIYLEEKRLERWIHNKTISKCCDSFRISSETKTYLKTLRII